MQAISLYHTAAFLGHGEAAYNLALIHQGRNATGDMHEYVRFLQMASELGTTRATTELAVVMTERNRMSTAFQLFTEAAKANVNLSYSYSSTFFFTVKAFYKAWFYGA